MKSITECIIYVACIQICYVNMFINNDSTYVFKTLVNNILFYGHFKKIDYSKL